MKQSKPCPQLCTDNVKSLSGQFSVNICEAPGVTCNIGGEAMVSSGILRETIFNVTLLHVACTMCDCFMM